MQETEQQSDPSMGINYQFGPEIAMENFGYSFHPLMGFELEIDDSVYMYTESGSVEVYMVGGPLERDDSIADLNDDLVSEFMENFDEYELIPAGTDKLKAITGFLNEINFFTPEEEGAGCALICSPFINQFFFILLIANKEFWIDHGKNLYEELKKKISFHPKFTPEILQESRTKHPDLTIETNETISDLEDFIVTIEKRDVSLLLAARSHSVEEQVIITEINAPDGQQLYSYDPGSGRFTSTICTHPQVGDHGEVCFFFPRSSEQSLMLGDYRFAFNTKTSAPLQEVQMIIRTGRALEQQQINFNLWLAVEDIRFSDPEKFENFEAEIRAALHTQLAPLNLVPGKIECYHPAPAELESFATINLDTDLADCSYMISESITNHRALNIGLVNRIFQGTPPTITDLAAACSGSPGMILAPGSPHTCILVSWSAFQGDIEALTEAILQQLVVFSGIETEDIPHQPQSTSLVLNKEIAWRLRRHPIFFDVD